MKILPRLIRLRDAPHYLAMDRNRFNREVRPYLTEVRIGKQGVAFDRVALDQWVDHYIERNGRLGQPMGDHIWDAKKRPDYKRRATSGTSTKSSKVPELQSLLAQAASTKQKNT